MSTTEIAGRESMCKSILTILSVNEEMGAELTGETLELIISLILQHKKKKRNSYHMEDLIFGFIDGAVLQRGEVRYYCHLNSLGLSCTHSPTQSVWENIYWAKYEIIFQTAGSLWNVSLSLSFRCWSNVGRLNRGEPQAQFNIQALIETFQGAPEVPAGGRDCYESSWKNSKSAIWLCLYRCHIQYRKSYMKCIHTQGIFYSYLLVYWSQGDQFYQVHWLLLL